MIVLVTLAFVALTPRAGAQTDAPDTLTVVTLNIWNNNADWPARLDLITRQLEALRPDVVMLQEVLQNPELPNQAQTIADRLGFDHVHFVSVDSVGAPKRYGNAIVSAYPFVETATLRLPPFDAYRMAAYALIEINRQPVRLYTTHLQNPATVEGRGIRAMEIAHLIELVETTGGDAPLVLGGDFNAEPTWPEMRMLDGYRDLGGAGITFGPPYTGVAGRRIDYLFDAAHPGLVPVSAGVALDRPDAEGRYPSDHFAVFARFVLP
ncbi:MAG: endonuclease/exonuclease/phosphatase family protein [Rubricoccaceae bacterium]